MAIARYTMITHKKDVPNPIRHKLLKSGTKRMSWDGLNSLRYEVLKVIKTNLFTRIVVFFNETEIMKFQGKS